VCWTIWKGRNKVVFDKKVIRHPAEIVLHACSLLSYWAGLFTLERQEDVAAGVEVALSVAHKLLVQQNRQMEVGRLMAPRGDRSEEDEGA
jgi:hypothetical protein